MNQLAKVHPYIFMPEASAREFERMTLNWYDYSCATEGVIPKLWHGMAFKDEVGQSFILEFLNELAAYEYYKEQNSTTFNPYDFPVATENFVQYHMDMNINEHFIQNVDNLERKTLRDMHIFFRRNQMCFADVTDKERIFNLPLGGAW